MDDNIFSVGTQFNTLADFEDSLHKLESSERQKFRITNSRLLDKKEGNKLRFAYATFSCERTGEYKPTGSGVRQARYRIDRVLTFLFHLNPIIFVYYFVFDLAERDEFLNNSITFL